MLVLPYGTSRICAASPQPSTSAGSTATAAAHALARPCAQTLSRSMDQWIVLVQKEMAMSTYAVCIKSKASIIASPGTQTKHTTLVVLYEPVS